MSFHGNPAVSSSAVVPSANSFNLKKVQHFPPPPPICLSICLSVCLSTSVFNSLSVQWRALSRHIDNQEYRSYTFAKVTGEVLFCHFFFCLAVSHSLSHLTEIGILQLTACTCIGITHECETNRHQSTHTHMHSNTYKSYFTQWLERWGYVMNDISDKNGSLREREKERVKLEYCWFY